MVPGLTSLFDAVFGTVLAVFGGGRARRALVLIWATLGQCCQLRPRPTLLSYRYVPAPAQPGQ